MPIQRLWDRLFKTKQKAPDRSEPDLSKYRLVKPREIEPTPSKAAPSDRRTPQDNPLGLSKRDMVIWDAYGELLEDMGEKKIHYLDTSHLPAEKTELEAILKNAIRELGAKGYGKDALNTCVVAYVNLSLFYDLEEMSDNEEAMQRAKEAIEAKEAVGELGFGEKTANDLAMERWIGPAALAEMESRLSDIKQFFDREGLEFPK
jgi:hypothetical protein